MSKEYAKNRRLASATFIPSFAALIGSFVTLAGFATTFYLGIREDRRKQEEHEARMKKDNADEEE